MKKQKSVALLAILAFCFVQASAQESSPPLNHPNYNQPKIFADVPERMPLHVADAEELLSLPVGTRVNATLAAGLPLVGVVVSKSNETDTAVKSVVIRTNRQGAVFTFTRVAVGGNITYRGRMLNKSNGDALEIVREGDGYVLRKKNINELLNE